MFCFMVASHGGAGYQCGIGRASGIGGPSARSQITRKKKTRTEWKVKRNEEESQGTKAQKKTTKKKKRKPSFSFFQHSTTTANAVANRLICFPTLPSTFGGKKNEKNRRKLVARTHVRSLTRPIVSFLFFGAGTRYREEKGKPIECT